MIDKNEMNIQTRKHVMECVATIAGESAAKMYDNILNDAQIEKLSSALSSAILSVADDFTIEQRIELLRSLAGKAKIVYGEEAANEVETIINALVKLNGLV